MNKLTEAQRRVLSKMADGIELVRHFDVWGGYWWNLEPMAEKVRKATVDALLRANTITLGNTERVFSGRQQTVYSLTPVGRLAISGKADSEDRSTHEA